MHKKIPDKLYFKIGEVAQMAEVPTHVIRYWESEFDSIRPKRANSKQRLFRKQDIEQVLKVKTLLHRQGYTIAGARKLLEQDELQESIGTRASTEVAERLKKLKQEVIQLQNLLVSEKQ